MQILTLLRILLNRKIFDNEQYGRFCVRKLGIISLNEADSLRVKNHVSLRRRKNRNRQNDLKII